ncbi:MAG: hypothetical protein HKO12_06630 [Woeseiaceae bacterium]|nr:hypothetical protein [Woeseiaceae bacterium]
MRSLLFLLTLFLTACGGNGAGFDVAPEPVQHAPEISNLKLSPDSALHMAGGGSVQVTAEFAFIDLGRDIQTLHVRMSDGTDLSIPVSKSANSVSGTLNETFDVTTANGYGCTIEIWLVDKAGQSSNHLFAVLSIIRHAPEISNLQLSPDSALYREGNGSIVVTAEITFRDAGRDLQTLWIQLPDGTSIEFDEPIATETGTLTKDFTISTETVGALAVEFWLVDKAGESSTHHSTEFIVTWNAQSSDWSSRLSGLPYALHDVIWDGSAFVAVGDSGAVLTSADGIDWVTRLSGIDADLNAVAAYGSDIFAVGFETVLHSTDHGATWVAKAAPAYIVLSAVAINSSHVVVAGNVPDLFGSLIYISADRGDTWQDTSINCGYFCGLFADLYYRDGLFIAATTGFGSGGRAMVSSDAAVWTVIFYDEGAGLFAIVHDGSQYVVSGGNGAVFKSFDGLNWTKTHPLVADVDYLSGAWNGSKLVLAGGYSWRYYSRRVVPPLEVPVGISSTDGGVTWEVFNIDGNYQSSGMAFGNGRFVSVGQSAPVSGEGAIYTAD